MSRDIDWYSEIIQVDGEPRYGTKVDAAYAEAYRGRLPDFLLRFWTEFGFGALGNGMLWLCDPVLLAPVMETVFAGDPEFAPADILAVTYDAYGRIGAYHPQYGGVTVDCVQEYWALYSQETLTSKLPMENDVGSLLAPPEDWVDDSGEELFPQAVTRLGLLNYGEVYGFFPALKIGGEMRAENLQKVSIREHLLFLAQLDRFKLEEYFYRENDPENPFGGSRFIRMIGPRR
jgi:hypothetical protein